MVVYSCQEIDEFYDAQTEKAISPDKVWELADKKINPGNSITFHYPEDDIIAEPVFKQKVQILWRAQQKEVDVPITIGDHDHHEDELL